jgi:hypothetical protein
MSYKLLYEFSQTLSPKISRRDIRAKSLEITGIPTIRHCVNSMDINVCRGMYLTPKNEANKIVSNIGKHVIVTARGLNYCWERFIYVKELMHVFGSSAEATDSGAKFETLLNEFSKPSNTTSDPMKSEIDAFWMALGVLCPESKRQEFLSQRAANEIDDYSIACTLRIPEEYVPQLFVPQFNQIIEYLNSK